MPISLLTDRSIASLKPTAEQVDYFDRSFPGFGVRVSQSGRKTFMVMYRNSERKLVRMMLGQFGTHPPGVTLATARGLARKELQKLATGRDPAAERQTAREQTFGKLAELYLERHAKRRKRSWRDDARMIRQELEDWKDRPATSIRRKDVRELLDEIVDRGAPVLANRVLSLIRKMLNFGLDREWLEVNPAHRMPRPSVEQSRTRVLTPPELRHVWLWLERPAAEDADDTQRRHLALAQAALKLRLITAQRGGQVIGMRWADADLTSGWWTIPSEDFKNKLAHRVPLTPMALKILKALRADAAEDAVHVFSGVKAPRHRRGALDGLKVADLRPHDFRRTAASLMAAAGISRLVIAKVLNHVETGVTSIYDRHGYDAEKRVALDTWERTFVAILKNKPTTVTPFSQRR